MGANFPRPNKNKAPRKRVPKILSPSISLNNFNKDCI
uniref:Uncharacterized protein n=1 Tax=Rhizophora mucronata TaxID=61149 RepID=A0A2P2LWQ2_RHIMU